MSTTQQNPVILMTEQRRRRKGTIWVAGGAALAVAALGGGTFALWSDTASYSGGTITAGDLDLKMISDTMFYDISPDRDDIDAVVVPGIAEDDAIALVDTTEHLNVSGDKSVQNLALHGHRIQDLGTWRMVPGDTVAAIGRAQMRLVGDNLVAELSVDAGSFGVPAAGDSRWVPGESGEVWQQNTAGFTASNVKYSYTLYDSTGTPLVGYDHVAIPDDGTFSGVIGYFAAPMAGQEDGQADAEDTPVTVVELVGDGTYEFVFVIEAAFQDVNGRTDAGAADRLGSQVVAEDVISHSINLSLKQFRAGTENAGGVSGIGGQQTN